MVHIWKPRFPDLGKRMRKSLVLAPKLPSHWCQEMNTIFGSRQYEYLLAQKVIE